MPEKRTLERARQKKQRGDAPSTQAGEFVREEMEHVKKGRHGVKNPKQAIAIGLSKARRAGVDLPAPERGKAKTRRSAARAHEKGQREGPLAERKAARRKPAAPAGSRRSAGGAGAGAGKRGASSKAGRAARAGTKVKAPRARESAAGKRTTRAKAGTRR